MDTTETTRILRTLTAKEGCLLTARIIDTEPYFSKIIYLGTRASVDDYIEVTDVEAQKIKTEWEESHPLPTVEDAETEKPIEARDHTV